MVKLVIRVLMGEGSIMVGQGCLKGGDRDMAFLNPLPIFIPSPDISVDELGIYNRL